MQRRKRLARGRFDHTFIIVRHAPVPPMKSNAISTNNAAVAALPKHLLQFAVDQRYDDYTPSITRSGASSCGRTRFS
jgi:hypothetical protein